MDDAIGHDQCIRTNSATPNSAIVLIGCIIKWISDGLTVFHGNPLSSCRAKREESSHAALQRMYSKLYSTLDIVTMPITAFTRKLEGICSDPWGKPAGPPHEFGEKQACLRVQCAVCQDQSQSHHPVLLWFPGGLSFPRKTDATVTIEVQPEPCVGCTAENGHQRGQDHGAQVATQSHRANGYVVLPSLEPNSTPSPLQHQPNKVHPPIPPPLQWLQSPPTHSAGGHLSPQPTARAPPAPQTPAGVQAEVTRIQYTHIHTDE